jgi:protein gp37
MAGKMFPFITTTWNPLGGECKHECSYCWAKQLTKKYNMQKYTGQPTLNTKESYRTFKPTDFVFTCDMTDLFGSWVPSEMIQAVLNMVEVSPAKFLLLTKNPIRYLEFKLPKNAVAGATIESDIGRNGFAPKLFSRIEAMRQVKHAKMVSIEPIMDFSENFPYAIVSTKPDFVAVGYDNYNNGLPEPSLDRTKDLIAVLQDWHIKVYEKTMRERLEAPLLRT